MSNNNQPQLLNKRALRRLLHKQTLNNSTNKFQEQTKRYTTLVGTFIPFIGCITIFVLIASMIIGLIEGIIYLTKSDEEFVNTYINNKKPWF